jgi:hypothetical protein
MKTLKMNFGNIKNVLSRSEMKKIMAGSDCGYGVPCGQPTGGGGGTSYFCKCGPGYWCGGSPECCIEEFGCPIIG